MATSTLQELRMLLKRSAADVWNTLTLIPLIVCLVLAAMAVALHFLVGLSLHVVLSSSMEPTYSPGDFIVTRVVDTSTLHRGQIAMFTPPDQDAPVAHRIVTARHEDGTVTLVTKGDANQTADLWTSVLVDPEVPIHVGTIPYLGAPMLHLPTPQARAAAVAAVGGIVTTMFIVGIILRPPCRCTPQCADES